MKKNPLPGPDKFTCADGHGDIAHFVLLRMAPVYLMNANISKIILFQEIMIQILNRSEAYI
jgi:hypothetical protein